MNYAAKLHDFWIAGLPPSPGVTAFLWFLAAASFVCFVLIFCTIYRNKRLQAHPMKIFMYMAALDSYTYASYLLCTFNPIASGYYKLVSWTLLMAATPQSYYRSAEAVYDTMIFLERLFWVPTIIFVICISVDLILLVRYPFSDHQKRVQGYIFVTIFVSVVTAALKLTSALTQGKSQTFLVYLEIIEYGILGLFALSSIIITTYRLMQPGCKQELKSLIVKRHILFITVFLFCNMFVCLLVSHTSNNTAKTTVAQLIFFGLFQILYFSQGIWMLVIRLTEEGFRKALIETLRYFWAKLTFNKYEISKTEDYELQPLYFFLNSALNVELVFVILKGITYMNQTVELRLGNFGDEDE